MLENKNNSPYGIMSITKHRESANVSNTTRQQLDSPVDSDLPSDLPTDLTQIYLTLPDLPTRFTHGFNSDLPVGSDLPTRFTYGFNPDLPQIYLNVR